MKIAVSAKAAGELDAALDYLEQHNPTAARSLRSALRRAILSLRDFPGRGRQGRAPGTRELLVRRVPYIVVYIFDEDTVFVLSVRHTRRGTAP